MRPTIYRPSLAIAIAAVLGACSNPTEVSVATPSVAFNVGEGSSVPAGQPILPLIPQLRVGEGEIDVLGHFRTATPCWALASQVARVGNVITLTVSAQADVVDACTQVITVRPYEARIAPLGAGVYTVRVVHQVLGGKDQPELMLEQRVQVQ